MRTWRIAGVLVFTALLATVAVAGDDPSLCEVTGRPRPQCCPRKGAPMPPCWQKGCSTPSLHR